LKGGGVLDLSGRGNRRKIKKEEQTGLKEVEVGTPPARNRGGKIKTWECEWGGEGGTEDGRESEKKKFFENNSLKLPRRPKLLRKKREGGSPSRRPRSYRGGKKKGKGPKVFRRNRPGEKKKRASTPKVF